MTGKVLAGVAKTGGGENEDGPAILVADPLSGSIIEVSDRRLIIKLATKTKEGGVYEGVGIDPASIHIELNGAEIFDGTTWIATYAGSYLFPHADDGSYTVVVLRNSDWLPATRYFLFIYVSDNYGVEAP